MDEALSARLDSWEAAQEEEPKKEIKKSIIQ